LFLCLGRIFHSHKNGEIFLRIEVDHLSAFIPNGKWFGPLPVRLFQTNPV